jgi:mono/diheme cytochrome c family protein
MVRLRAFGATARQARGLLIVAAAILGVSVTMWAQEKRSVKAGVYTAAQAERGVAVYRSKCASCHAPNRFTDDFFYVSFAGKPLWEMFDVISDSMPEDNPGSLTKEQYADVIAYLLQLNKFPAGETDLPTDKDALSEILFEKPVSP